MITQEFWVYLVWGIRKANIVTCTQRFAIRHASSGSGGKGVASFFLQQIFFLNLHIGNWTIIDLPPSSTFWGLFKTFKNWSENQERCSEIALQIFALTLYHKLNITSPTPGLGFSRIWPVFSPCQEISDESAPLPFSKTMLRVWLCSCFKHRPSLSISLKNTDFCFLQYKVEISYIRQ